MADGELTIAQIASQNNMADIPPDRVRLVGDGDRNATNDYRGGTITLSSLIAQAVAQFNAGIANPTTALSDIAALDAIASTGIINRQVLHVLDGTDNQTQTWIYDAAATGSASDTMRVPSDSPTTGRWVTRDHPAGGGGTPAPSITALNPDTVFPTQSVTITGTDLLDAVIELTASGGGRVMVTPTTNTATEQIIFIPASGAVSGPVWATTAGGEVQSPINLTIAGAL